MRYPIQCYCHPDNVVAMSIKGHMTIATARTWFGYSTLHTYMPWSWLHSLCVVHCIIAVPLFTCHLDVIEALNHQLDDQWRGFGTFLHVEPAVMNKIESDKKKVEACMLQLVEKWLGCDNGTGDLPRTWKTVVQAVKDTGKGHLAQLLAEQHGLQLSGQ